MLHRIVASAVIISIDAFKLPITYDSLVVRTCHLYWLPVLTGRSPKRDGGSNLALLSLERGPAVYHFLFPFSSVLARPCWC